MALGSSYFRGRFVIYSSFLWQMEAILQTKLGISPNNLWLIDCSFVSYMSAPCTRSSLSIFVMQTVSGLSSNHLCICTLQKYLCHSFFCCTLLPVLGGIGQKVKWKPSHHCGLYQVLLKHCIAQTKQAALAGFWGLSIFSLFGQQQALTTDREHRSTYMWKYLCQLKLIMTSISQNWKKGTVKKNWGL